MVYFQNYILSLVRNDNRNHIGGILNVKIRPSNDSIVSTPLQTAVACAAGSDFCSGLFQSTSISSDWEVRWIKEASYLGIWALLLEADDVSGKFLAHGDCHFLFLCFCTLYLLGKQGCPWQLPVRYSIIHVVLPGTAGSLKKEEKASSLWGPPFIRAMHLPPWWAWNSGGWLFGKGDGAYTHPLCSL